MFLVRGPNIRVSVQTQIHYFQILPPANMIWSASNSINHLVLDIALGPRCVSKLFQVLKYVCNITIQGKTGILKRAEVMQFLSLRGVILFCFLFGFLFGFVLQKCSREVIELLCCMQNKNSLKHNFTHKNIITLFHTKSFYLFDIILGH